MTEVSDDVTHILKFDPAFQSLESVVVGVCFDFSCNNAEELLAAVRSSLFRQLDMHYSKPNYSILVRTGSVGFGSLPAVLIEFERNLDNYLQDSQEFTDNLMNTFNNKETSKEAILELLAKTYFNEHKYDEAMAVSYIYFQRHLLQLSKTSFSDKIMYIIFAESARIRGDIRAALWAYTMVHN